MTRSCLRCSSGTGDPSTDASTATYPKSSNLPIKPNHMTNSYTTVPGLFRKFLFAGVALAMSVLYSVSSWGQAATYNFAASAGSYSPISGGTVFFATGAPYDDNTTASITIPSFTYAGTAYTVLRVNTNGWCSFGAATSTTGYTPMSGAVTAASAVLAPFGEDQQNSATSEIRYEDTGTEFVVQWKDVRRFGTTETLNYQLRLQYSASPQTFSFVYGTMTNGADTNPQVGHKTGAAAGTIGTTMFNLTLKNIPSGTSCDWIDAVRGRLNSETMLLNTGTNSLITCASGTTFTFTPQSGTIVNPVTVYTAATGVTSSAGTVNWTAPTNATQYDVQYRAVGTCAWTQFSTAQAGTSAALTGLSPLTSYQVRVRAASATNSGAYSHAALTGTNTDGYTTTGYFTTLAGPATVTQVNGGNSLCSAGNQSVIITGTSFTGATAVTFNGVNAITFTVNSATQVTATTPIGVTAGSVVVTTAVPTPVGLAYTVYTNPTVTIAPNDTLAACGSYPQVVTASGATTYAWTAISGSLSNLSNPAINAPTLNATGNGTFQVTGTALFGCFGRDTLVVNYTPAPYVAITPTIAQFCGSGGLTTVSAASANDPNYAYTFTSLETGLLSNTLAASTDFTVTQTAAIRIEAVDATNLCRVVRDTSISVYSFPALTLTATPDTICAGGTSVLASGLTAGTFSSATIPHSPLNDFGTATYLANNSATPVVTMTSGTLDDGGWQNIPLGFTFNFFGTSYTQCNVGTNGTIMFGTYNGTGLGDFTFGALPSVTEPLGMVAVLAMDNNLGSVDGGSISYWTTGYAPNRKFIVRYQAAKEFGDTKYSTAQAIFYESTGIVDVHVTSSTNLDRNKVVGINGPTGLIGTLAFASGTIAAANNPIVTAFAYRFTPPSSYTTSWTPAANVVNPDNGVNIFGGTTEVLATPGTETFTFTAQSLVTGCTGGGTVDVEVLSIPGAVAGGDLEAYGDILGAGSAGGSPYNGACGDQTITYQFTGTLSGLEQVNWYDASTGGTLLGTGNSYTTAVLLSGVSDTVYAEFNNGFCTSPARTQFITNIQNPPAVTITTVVGADINCGVGPTYPADYQAASSNDPNYTYTWTNDGIADTFNDLGGGLADLTSDSTTVSTLVAFDAGTGCSVTTLKAFSIFAFPVVTPTAASDTICVGDSTLLNSGVAVGTFGVACRTVALRTPVSPTSIISNPDGATPTYGIAPASEGLAYDDAGWSGIPIGFPFDYFGTTFTDLNVGTNGTVTFGTYVAADVELFFFDPWPSVNNPANSIAVIATDMRFNTVDAAGAEIRYWTEGVTPNRVFVLEYLNVPGWSGTVGNQWVQLHLFETTGVVEIHAEEATYTGAKSIALQNGDGTIGSAAPRCFAGPGNFWDDVTNTIPAAFSEAWTFSPPVSYTFDWDVDGEISGSDSSATAMALPTTAVPATVTYTLGITDNVSGCVGTPVTVDVEVIAIPSAPNVTGYGSFSDVDGVNTVNICGDQDVLMYVSDNLDPTNWTAKYYDAAVGGTLLFTAAPYNDTITIAGLTATDSVWVAMDNGYCEGARRLVEMVMQVADPISISFVSGQDIVCGTGSFSAELLASSTAPYSYTWNPGNILGASTGTINYSNTVVYQVDGDDGFCYTSATQSLSRYDFPVVNATAQFDSVCPGNTSVLNANVDSTTFSVTSQGYAPVSFSTPTFLVQNASALVTQDQGTLDDGAWWNVPLGFSYNFFGNTYTTVHVATNGNIQFGATPISTSFSPGAIPSPLAPNNYVAAAWTDWDFGNTVDGNSIRYETVGTAPNRVFVILFAGSAFFEDGTSTYTTQVELYETTGVVEIHIQDITDSGTNSIIVGVEDLTGTIGSAAPGRTGTWNTGPEGWRFEPPHDYSFAWSPALEIIGATNLDTCVAQPAGPGVTNYQLIVTDLLTTCDNSVNNQEFVPVGVVSAPPVATYSATPSLGTTGGTFTTHTLTPTSPEVGGDVYAWVFTPATVTYVNGTSASSRVPQVQFNAPGTYGAALTITRCGGAPVTFSSPTVFSIAAVYCQPVFTSNGDGCSAFGDMVDDVTIKDPSNNTIMSHLNTDCGGGANGYNDYTSPLINGVTTCTMYQGSTYQITLDGAGDFEFYGVWVDVNNDGDFADPLECMGFTAVSALNATFDIGVPSENVIFGTHRMRVMASFSAINAGSYCINSTFGESHDYFVTIAPPIISNDIPTNGVNISYSSNVVFPNCVNLSGNTTLATNSPESAGSNGNDVWYRITAQSTGLSITLTSASMDDYIALYTKDLSGNYNLVAGGVENASSGNGDFERLNIGGLTPNTVYYISVGSASNASAGAFTLCVQHLMKSWPTFANPVGGFDLCSAYKAVYRGSVAQGANYSFTFTGTGGGAPAGPSTISGTNGLITLSNPALVPNIQYGGVYNCQVDVAYILNPSTGGAETVTVLGSVSDPNATGVQVKTQPNVEVKASQRCNASLLRTNYLIGTIVPGQTNPCGVINYSYEFQQVVGCADGTTVGAPDTVTTAGATPYLPLGVLANLANVGAWDVRIRPNFNYGVGSFGPVQRIQVANTSAGSELADNGMIDGAEKVETFVAANLYPNPNTGEMVNLNVSGVESDNVFVRVLDAMGRVVYSNRFTVDGSLNTIVTFAQPLASGIYNVEFTVDGEIMTERMIVTKQ